VPTDVGDPISLGLADGGPMILPRWAQFLLVAVGVPAAAELSAFVDSHRGLSLPQLAAALTVSTLVAGAIILFIGTATSTRRSIAVGIVLGLSFALRQTTKIADVRGSLEPIDLIIQLLLGLAVAALSAWVMIVFSLTRRWPRRQR
jgi:hypothetical protein